VASFTDWLRHHGLEQYAPAFLENEVDFALVRRLTDADLKELGLTLGARKRFLEAVENLGSQDPVQREGASIPQGAERRQLTILFCDLAGSTQLSQQLDPERLREVMQAYQQSCKTVIERYEGHVVQYLGDGLMVYFGWPRAHEDDAERAARSAMELIEAVKAVPLPAPLQVRIGIATGPVVVGETGAGDASVPKLAVGETPNLAARLQGLAGPDQIIIAPSTHRLTGGAFTYAALEPQVLKGILEAVQPFRVTGRGEAEGRFDAAHGQSTLMPMVGRESELALIHERWAQTLAGEGQLVLLAGKPGIGKSRVTQALRQGIEGQAHLRTRYQCSPYHTQSALYPMVEHIERAAGFAREDSAELKLEKLEALLRPGGQDLAAVMPLFAALLSLPTEKYPPLNFSPQKQKEKLLEAMVEQIGGLAKTQPVLMVFEDAHWLDPTTQELLDLLVSRIARWRVMLLITHRMEYIPGWSGEAHVTSVTLNRFNPRLGALLAEKVTGGKALPAQVIEQIVAKTDGVPLFVEELTKHVLESGFLKDTGTRYELDGPLLPLAIPSTLHDSLMARLDRLAPVKEVAQVGACIGREFSYELLAAISPMSERHLYRASSEIDEQILDLARRSGESSALAMGHQSTCGTALFVGEFQRAREHGDAGWAAYDRDRHRDLAVTLAFDPGALCLDFGAWAQLIMGYPDQSARRHAMAMEFAKELRHPVTLATVVVHAAFVACLREDVSATLEHACEVIAYCKEKGILIRQVEGEILEGWALAELGDTTRGIPQIEAGIQLWLQLGAQIANPWWFCCLARAYAKAGRLVDPRESLKQAFDATNKNGERIWETELYRIEGDLWLDSNGSEAQAEASYRKAIEVAQELKARLWKLRASTALAHLWHSQGKCSEAIALLEPVYDWFTEGFDTRDLKEAKALLGTLAQPQRL
jgi:class 3 adenylate cyclase/predicted ATPase